MSLVVSRQGTDTTLGATAWCIKQMHHYVRTTILKLGGDGVSNSLGCFREGDQTIPGAFCMRGGKRLGTGKGDARLGTWVERLLARSWCVGVSLIA